MSRSLGVLTLDLIAKTGGFEQGMDRASRRVRQTANEMEAAKRAADRLVAGIAAAAAGFATAATAMAVSSARSIDATAKMAQQIGTTTEVLTGMRFAAQQFANISDQQFDMSMRRMTRRIAEAAEGSGAAKGALDAMGLSARELARLSPEKQMLAIADAMHRTERQADRLRYTMAIFDTEGMALVPALQQGAEAFEQNIELARRFGVVVSTEAAQAAEQFTTNMGLLSKAQEGFRNQLAEAVLPILADFSGHLVEIAQRIGPMGETIEKALKAAGVAAAATAAIFVSRLIGSITASAMAWTAATAEAARYQMTLARMAASAAGASTAVTAMTGAAAGGMAVMGRVAQVALGVLGGPAGLLVTAGLTAAAFLTMGRDARTAATDVDALTESLDTYNRRQLESAAFNLENELVELSKQAEGHGQILRGLINDYDGLTARYGENYEGLRNVRQAIRDEEEALEAVISTIAKKSPLLAEITQRLWDMDAASRGAAGGVETLNEAMTNEAGKTYLERLADQAITAGLKTQREQLEALVAAGKLVYTPEDLEKARKHADHIDRMRAAYKGAGSAAKEFESSVKSLLDTYLPQEKALSDLHKNLALLDKAQKAGIVTGQNYVKALESINKAYAKQVNDLLPESIKKAQEQVKAAKEQQKQLQLQVRTFGLAESAILALAAADTAAAIAKLEATRASEIADGATVERVKNIDAEIQALRELRDLQLGSAGLQSQIEWKEAQKQQWEEWARDVEQIFDRVGQSLTDAIFDGGKSGKDLLRDMFKGLTFNILINPVMKSLQGMVTQQLGGLFGLQGPQQSGAGGLLQNASSLNSIFGAGYQALTGASVGASPASLAYANTVGAFGGDSIGALISANGGWEGALSGLSTATNAAFVTGAITAAPTVAATLSAPLASSMATTTFSASLSGGAAAGAAGGAAAGGAGGLVSGLASAAPWIAGGLAVASAFGLFDDRLPTTRRSQMGASHMLPDGTFEVTHWDDRQDMATQEAARSFAEQAVKSANELFEKAGVDAAIWGFQTLMESSILGDKQGVGSSGQVRVGDVIRDIGLTVESSWTRHGVGGWSEAEMLPRLQADIQLTILEAFQAAGDALPSVLSGMLEGVDIRSLGAEQALALSQQFQLVIEQVGAFQLAVESLPFATLRDLSFDAAANLISFAGGLEALDAGMSTYFQNFYSEAEQLDWLSQQLSTAFEGIGQVMPDVTQGADAAKAAYRELVESLDVTTEEGQRAYATLMTLSGGFAELVTGLEGLNDSVGALREREGLERQWLALIGDETELRRRDLELLDPSNRALQEMIWLRQDEMKAADEAARVIAEAQEAARAVEQERYGLETQLLQLQGDTVALRARELDALSPLNRGLQQQIWTLQDAAAAQQAYERSIQSVTGSLAGIRETVLLDQLGSDDARYGYFKQQADGLARLLPQLTDESAITQTISQIASITGRAYGLLDDEQKQSMGDEFLDYIDRTETIATRQIQAIQEGQRQAAKEQAEAMAKAVAHEVGRIANAIIKSVEGMPASTANAIRNAVAQNTGQRTTQYREVEFAEVNA